MSTSKGDAEPAEPGLLLPEVARDLSLLREFFAHRDRLERNLYGRNTRRSALRDELRRLVVSEYAQQRIRTATFYHNALQEFGSRPTITGHLDFLVSVSCIVIRSPEGRARLHCVYPTRKLITFYNHYLPRLRQQFLRAFLKDHSQEKTE